jgi:hypothetical protein
MWLGEEDLCSGITVPLDLVNSQVNIPFTPFDDPYDDPPG